MIPQQSPRESSAHHHDVSPVFRTWLGWYVLSVVCLCLYILGCTLLTRYFGGLS